MKQINVIQVLLLTLVLATTACQQSNKGIVDAKKFDHPVKLACVGNSITFGSGIEHRDSLCYPERGQLDEEDKQAILP